MTTPISEEIRQEAMRHAVTLWPEGERLDPAQLVKHANAIATYLAPTTREQEVEQAASKAVSDLNHLVRATQDDGVSRRDVDTIAMELSRALPF